MAGSRDGRVGPRAGEAAPLYDATTVWGLVAARAARTPEATMLLDGSDRTATFGQVAERAERVAAGLAAVGAGPGTRVSWQLPTTIDAVVVSLALARLDAVQNPIIPIYRQRELRFILAQTGAELVVVDSRDGRDTAAVREAAAGTTLIDLADGVPDGDPATLAPSRAGGPGDDPVRWAYYTSGTTSDPKGVLHTDGTLLAGAEALARAIRARDDDVGSIAFPYAHIGGPDYLGLLLFHGIPAVLLERFVPAEAVEAFRRHGVTLAGGSTVFYEALLAVQRETPGRPILPDLRLLVGGGAPKPPELFHEVRAELGVPIIHGWAMTEAPMICCGRPDDTDEQLAETEGRPVHGAEVRTVDADGRPLGPGEEGELSVRGPMLTRGYADPALDAASFDADGWFRTGDVGRLRADGHLLITGRKKDIIIRKGENISAREVEDVLYQHPRIRAVAVIGVPDRQRGERVCAVIEAAGDAPTLDEVREHCRAAGLMVQKTPEQLEVVEALPRNATQKVLKHELRARYGGA
jgi:cyclohexanecarboxylate-CoA ligase